MLRYLVRRAYRYGDRIYLPGEAMYVASDSDRVVMQQRGIIGGPVVERPTMETATRPPAPEAAVMPEPGPKPEPEPEPRHVGGGWYELADGRRVRKSQLEDD